MAIDIKPFNARSSSSAQIDGDNTMNERVTESLPRNSQCSSSVPAPVKVVTTESRIGGAQWPKDMHRVKDSGSAEQSIYLRGKSVSGSLGKFHAKGLVSDNNSYTSIEQRMLKNQRNNEHRVSAPVASPSSTHKKRRMLRRLWKSIASFPVATAKSAAESPASMTPSERSVAKVSGESTATKATAVTSESRLRNRSSQVTHQSSNSQSTTALPMTTSSSNDPILSRLFRAPIRKKPKKKSRESPAAAAATTTTTTGKPKKTKKRAKPAKTNRRSPKEATDAAVLSTSELNDSLLVSSADNSENEGGIEDKASPTNTRHILTGCPCIWSRKTKINHQAASNADNPAASPAVAMAAQRKPPRQRVSPSGLYLLVCVGLFCMPCLCINYACHHDEEL
ncbi:hypothetical protein BDF22DRAFT_656453 [Syncephalis plumigaleata]|nr:hypothetical protein BDF22DRAFT_656453 [Syncephalis plumigaleata]